MVSKRHRIIIGFWVCIMGAQVWAMHDGDERDLKSPPCSEEVLRSFQKYVAPLYMARIRLLESEEQQRSFEQSHHNR